MTQLAYRRPLVCFLIVAAFGWAMVGCSKVTYLSAQETKQLLRQLPYRYEFRSVATPEGAKAAVAGRAVGRHHTVLNFGIAIGGQYAVPVPRAGTIDPYGYPRGGFIFNDDEFIKGTGGRRMAPNPHLHTARQFKEAGHMSVMMTDKLCLAATGEHCPP